MPLLRRRAALLVLALAASVALVAIALPDHHERKSAVGTNGPEAAEAREDQPLAAGDAPATAEATSPSAADDQVATAGRTTTTRPSEVSSTSTTASPGATTTTLPGPTSLAHRLAFLVSSGEGNAWTEEVWSMREDGTDLRHTLPPCGHSPHFASTLDVSPDGTLVARVCGDVVRNPDGLRVAEDYGIAVQDVATGTRSTILHLGFLDSAFARFSPEGGRLAVSTTEGLLVIDLDDLEVHAVPVANVDSSLVTWSPDGRHLLTTNTLQVIDVATGAVQDLSGWAPPLPDGWLSSGVSSYWGPDGFIYHSSQYSFTGAQGTTRLYRIDPATGARIQLRERTGEIMWFRGVLEGGRLLLQGDDSAIVVGPDGSVLDTLPVEWRFGLVAPQPPSCGSASLLQDLLATLQPCRAAGGLATTG